MRKRSQFVNYQTFIIFYNYYYNIIIIIIFFLYLFLFIFFLSINNFFSSLDVFEILSLLFKKKK